MSALHALLVSHPLPTWRTVAWPVIGVLTVAIGWAGFARLDEVAVAHGEVVPRGKVKIVQHLEGGIIERIAVTEGDTVNAGDPLVHLDLAMAGVNRRELQARLDGELLRRARLGAEVSGEPLALPSEPAERHPSLALAEKRAFQARTRELDSRLKVLDAQFTQKMQEVRELEARKQAVSRNLALARERLEMSRSLLSEGLTARMDHLELEAEVENLEGELATLAAAIPRARAGVAEAGVRLDEAQDRHRREIRELEGQSEQAIAQLRERFDEATEQGMRAVVRSPIDGVVKNMRYNTIGGVVSPGEAIMEIVPTGDRLVIDAKLSPTDRGYVEEGQRAVVKVSTYDFVRYGGLDGTVIHVAPDSSTTAEGIPYFRVVVETDKTYLGDAAGKLPILPGMQATVDIHTGTKSILDYLIKPVLKLRSEAFRER